MTAQEIILRTLGQSTMDAQLSLDLQRVEQRVRNYCNIDEIPEALVFAVADMVLDLYKSQQGDNLMVSQIRMGDTSYNLTVDKAIDRLLKDYRQQLQAFRRLRW